MKKKIFPYICEGENFSLLLSYTCDTKIKTLLLLLLLLLLLRWFIASEYLFKTMFPVCISHGCLIGKYMELVVVLKILNQHFSFSLAKKTNKIRSIRPKYFEFSFVCKTSFTKYISFRENPKLTAFEMSHTSQARG